MKFKLFIVSIVLIFLMNFFKAGAQFKVTETDKPYVFNTAGGTIKSEDGIHDFNVGEMVLVQTFNYVGCLLTQGFLQPYFLPAVVIPLDVLIENNILTPNSDGVNDFFVVKGIENYHQNKLSIYDPAGRKIYSVSNYKNNWDGYYQGKPLNEDTYYYVIDLGEGRPLLKGFISILLDN